MPAIDEEIGAKGTASDNVALALSGGGSRAIAFHLGCLRALNEVGLLREIQTISAVSGGSVIAGLYCSYPGSFEDFELRVREILARGFVWPSIKAALTTTEGVRATSTFFFLSIDRFAAFVARWGLSLCGLQQSNWSWLRMSPIVRRSSRTTILRRAMRKIFNGILLKDLREDRPRLVVIACELRAKAAFYFTAESLHCWRYGASSSKGIELADAVTASAAYPAALPVIEEVMPFEKDGATTKHRVTITDGGVYDNLGLAPFWPGRDPTISLDVGKFDRIIACRAGYGLNIADPASTMFSRLNAAFESVFARAQNFATTRLFDLVRSGDLNGFLLPYLGQQDDKLKYPPTGLVARSEVEGYPTNFSAMNDKWIDQLSLRGEQLVYALLRENWPEWAPAT